MRIMHRHLLSFVLTAIAAASTAAFAAGEPADCAAFRTIDYNKTFNADPRDIDQCIQRGWDPPINWRPNEGRQIVSAPGAGGFTLSGRKPPERPPGAENARASVTSSMFNFTMGIPPWRGFPCQLPGGINLCGGGSGSSDGAGGADGSGGATGGAGGSGGSSVISSCPVAGDTTGTYGEQQPVTSSTSKPLACGGAIPLSTYMMSAENAPTGIIATEAGSRTVWYYRASGTGFALQGTLQLPEKTCTSSDPDSATPTPMPIAQILSIGSGTSSVALRLQMENPGDVADPFDPDPEAEKSRYFVVPTSGGTPQIPSGCPRTNDFIREAVALTAPLTVESATNPGCEGTAQACGSLPQNPTSPSSCDAVTTNPAGASCEGTTLFAVLNRPNLLLPPGSTATFSAMEGRTAHMTGATGTARLYTQADAIMYFGARGGSFTLPEGGTLKLDNGNILVMSGPAIINAGSRQVTMTNGGSIQTPDASTVQQFAANSSYAPQASLPFVVKVSRSVELPAGLKLPTQPSPFVRLPVKAE